MMVFVPALCVARTRVMDYWYDLGIDSNVRTVFNFNQSLRCDGPTTDFLRLLCQKMAFPYTDEDLPTYLSGENWLILKNYPEFEYFRDICFYSKYLLGTKPCAFPPIGNYSQKQAELHWAFIQGSYVVKAFGIQLTTQAKEHRWPFLCHC
eukprot:TRINITY_DN5939_c0_g1_i1.p1 TRINITY_DN5939_c0_g1~~TRINITY_DN5939_c0_g1_i1.p1  ORF type:complete len:150 (-),score=10.41 TRINITY_DN5939_c0_g1_i1:19-468(-)